MGDRRAEEGEQLVADELGDGAVEAPTCSLMSRMTSSIRNFERSGPSCSPIAVEPTTSATSTETIRRSPVATAMPEL